MHKILWALRDFRLIWTTFQILDNFEQFAQIGKALNNFEQLLTTFNNFENLATQFTNLRNFALLWTSVQYFQNYAKSLATLHNHFEKSVTKLFTALYRSWLFNILYDSPQLWATLQKLTQICKSKHTFAQFKLNVHNCS